LSRALAEVKNTAFEESKTRLDDAQALHAIVSSFKKEDRENETPQAHFGPLGKRLFLGTVIARSGGADTASGFRQR
jgi:hypothetical protein